MTMRYSIGSDDLIWLLRVAGSNADPHTLKEILADIRPIAEPVDQTEATDNAPDDMVKTDAPGMWPRDTFAIPPAKPE